MRETHGGELKHTGFGDRMRGSGKMAEVIADLFRLHVRKNGLDRPMPGNTRMPPRRAGAPAGRGPMQGPRRMPDDATTARKAPEIPDFQTDLFG